MHSVTGKGAEIELKGVSRSFGPVPALHDINLKIQQGEFVSLLGPSGCGKSTLLRIIAGLERIDSGALVVDGKDISLFPPHKRSIGLVFQQYALFPHMSVSANIAYPLRRAGIRDKAEINKRVDELLELVKLGDMGNRSPDSLSGGQAQRVALARALANQPRVLLLDEPLAALDLKLRRSMQMELRDLQRRLGTTFVFVTHDQEEAMVMSDSIVLMHGGRIEQSGRPEAIYSNPDTIFSADFFGEANIIQGRVSGLGDTVTLTYLENVTQQCEFVSNAHNLAIDDLAAVSLRPENIKIAKSADPSRKSGANCLSGVIKSLVFQGSTRKFIVETDSGDFVVVRPNSDQGASCLSESNSVVIEWPSESLVLLKNQLVGEA